VIETSSISHGLLGITDALHGAIGETISHVIQLLEDGDSGIRSKATKVLDEFSKYVK
jgi:hypothetical protein